MLVDEADSILIDEARTPLIISALPDEDEEGRSRVVSTGAPTTAPQFVEDEHYEYDHEKTDVELTAEGRRLVRELPQAEAMDRRSACSRSTSTSSGRSRSPASSFSIGNMWSATARS